MDSQGTRQAVTPRRSFLSGLRARLFGYSTTDSRGTPRSATARTWRRFRPRLPRVGYFWNTSARRRSTQQERSPLATDEEQIQGDSSIHEDEPGAIADVTAVESTGVNTTHHSDVDAMTQELFETLFASLRRVAAAGALPYQRTPTVPADGVAGNNGQTSHNSVTTHLPQTLQYEQYTAAPRRHRWVFNKRIDRNNGCMTYVNTYIDAHGRWHRVISSVKHAARYDGPRHTFEEEFHRISANSHRSASLLVYETIEDELPVAIEDLAFSSVHLWMAEGRIKFEFSAEMSDDQFYTATTWMSSWSLTTYNDRQLQIENHVAGFKYVVTVLIPRPSRRIVERGPFTFVEAPDDRSVASFLHEVQALHATRDCPFTHVIIALVVDESKSLLRGYLRPLPPRYEFSLYALLEYNVEQSQDRKLPWSLRKTWARQILAAVHALHSADFAHGDVCLRSISLVPANGHTELAHPLTSDLGHYQILLASPSFSLSGIETPYRAPERRNIPFAAQSHQRDKAEMYAVGVVLFALAAGDIQVEEQQSVPRLDELNDAVKNEIGEEYRLALNSCLSSDPRERRSAGELIRLFDAEEAYLQRTNGSTTPRARLEPVTSGSTSGPVIPPLDLDENARIEEHQGRHVAEDGIGSNGIVNGNGGRAAVNGNSPGTATLQRIHTPVIMGGVPMVRSYASRGRSSIPENGNSEVADAVNGNGPHVNGATSTRSPGAMNGVRRR